MTAAAEPSDAGPREPTLRPDVEIVDAHHHLGAGAHPYRPDDLFRDLASGHRVVATVYVENRYQYRTSGPEALRGVGETEFAAGVATASAALDGRVRACQAIVAGADITLGAALEGVIDAHLMAGQGRLRGFRQLTFWDDDERVWSYVSVRPRPGLMDDPAFRVGASALARHGLSLDLAVFHPQLPQVSTIAADVPELCLVLNHMGLPLGVGPYADRRAEVFGTWRSAMADLARRENVIVKLSGCGGALWGFDYAASARSPRSAALAERWRPYLETTIELFGPARCMFASNFPIDARAGDYHTVWNALKLIAAPYNAAEQADLFHGTATRTYRLPTSDRHHGAAS